MIDICRINDDIFNIFEEENGENTEKLTFYINKQVITLENSNKDITFNNYIVDNLTKQVSTQYLVWFFLDNYGRTFYNYGITRTPTASLSSFTSGNKGQLCTITLSTGILNCAFQFGIESNIKIYKDDTNYNLGTVKEILSSTQIKILLDNSSSYGTNLSSTAHVLTQNNKFVPVDTGKSNVLGYQIFYKEYYKLIFFARLETDSTSKIRIRSKKDTVPIGSIVAWHKSFASSPSIPEGYQECNGLICTQYNSPYLGQTVPNLNGNSGGVNSPNFSTKEKLVLRGSATSGVGEDDQFQGHQHFIGNNKDSTQVYVGGGTVGGFTQYNTFVWSTGLNTFTMIARDIASDGVNGTPKIGDETKVRNMSVVWIMKIT